MQLSVSIVEENKTLPNKIKLYRAYKYSSKEGSRRARPTFRHYTQENTSNKLY